MVRAFTRLKQVDGQTLGAEVVNEMLLNHLGARWHMVAVAGIHKAGEVGRANHAADPPRGDGSSESVRT